MIALAWIIFGAVVLGVIAFCYFIVRYYTDRNEAEPLPTWTTVIGLTLTLLSVFLIPVDIYSVSSSQDGSGNMLITVEEMETRSQSVKILYYILYSSILAFAFGIIPFAYFYYEEADEDVSIRQKIWAGCKYTIFLILIVFIFLAIGLFMFFVKPGDKPTSTENAKEWVAKFYNQSVLESSISFAIACLTVIGYVGWISYTAYGLSAFPISIIRGKKHIAEEVSDLSSNLDLTREKATAIQSKYLSGGKKMSKRDQGELDLLRRRERVLARQTTRLRSEATGWRKVWAAIRPFMFLFGIVFILFSILIVISILLTNIDKAMYAYNFCGAQCGFILAYPQIFNPLNETLTILSQYFPLDYVLLGAIIIYIFFTTLAGIIHIGVRFLWVNLYKIRAHSTPPQGLLLASVILMFSILCLNMEITTLAPQYAYFGSQKWFNVTSDKPQVCNLDAPPGKCTMTQIGTFVNQISVRTNFFGIIFFYATWVFVLTFLIGIVVAFFKAKPSNVEAREDDSDSDEGV